MWYFEEGGVVFFGPADLEGHIVPAFVYFIILFRFFNDIEYTALYGLIA